MAAGTQACCPPLALRPRERRLRRHGLFGLIGCAVVRCWWCGRHLPGAPGSAGVICMVARLSPRGPRYPSGRPA